MEECLTRVDAIGRLDQIGIVRRSVVELSEGAILEARAADVSAQQPWSAWTWLRVSTDGRTATEPETRRRCGRPREHIQPDIHATQVSKGHQKDESPDPCDGAEEPREHTQPRAHPGHSVSGGARPQRQARAVGRVVALDEGDGDWGDSRRLTRGGSGRQLAPVDEAEAWPIGGGAMAYVRSDRGGTPRAHPDIRVGPCTACGTA